MKNDAPRPLKTVTFAELEIRVKEMSQGASSEAPLVTEDGRPVGVFRPLPYPDQSRPLAERRRLFKKTSARMARRMDAKGITEEQLQRDFEALRGDRPGR